MSLIVSAACAVGRPRSARTCASVSDVKPLVERIGVPLASTAVANA
jgi:hypothetical protein